MIREVSTYGTKEGSSTKVHNRKRFLEQIGQLSDGRIEIIYRRVYKKRSSEQNRYYWGVIVKEFQTGYHTENGEWIDKEAVHTILQSEFNSKEVINKKTGEIIKVPKGTSKLTTSEYMDYIAECIRFIAEWFHIEVPEPGEQSEINF